MADLLDSYNPDADENSRGKDDRNPFFQRDLNPFNNRREANGPKGAYADDLVERWQMYKDDPSSLGMSDAEIEAAIAKGRQQSMSEQQANIMALNQASLAGQGFQAGGLAEAARNLTDEGAAAAGETSAQVNDLNQRLIEQRSNQLRSEVQGEMLRQEEVSKYNFDKLLKGVEALGPVAGAAIGSLFGGPAGGAIGAQIGNAVGTFAGGMSTPAPAAAPATPSGQAPTMPNQGLVDLILKGLTEQGVQVDEETISAALGSAGGSIPGSPTMNTVPMY